MDTTVTWFKIGVYRRGEDGFGLLGLLLSSFSFVFVETFILNISILITIESWRYFKILPHIPYDGLMTVLFGEIDGFTFIIIK